MKNLLKQTCGIIAGVLLLGTAQGNAQTIVTVDPGQTWNGYMNPFELPQNGGAWVGWGSSWAPADLTATFSGSTLTLAPNSIGDPNPYWYTPSGGPGSVGNKIMDASMYVESTGVLQGQTLTFTASVLSDTLTLLNNPLNKDANGNGWTSVAFIKDFAPDFSSFVSTTIALTPGTFSISLALINDSARHVQYGFETIGPDVWITDVAPFGSVVINPAPVPEPSTLALAAMGGMGLLTIFRRRNAK
jgi:hypothetical protein